MKCYHCGGKLLCVRSEQKGNDRHRWYRCHECDKTVHTVERWSKPGPATGTPKSGPAAHGERNGASIFTADNIIEVRELYASGVLQKDIAARFGTRQSYVSKIVNHHVWKHIPEGKPPTRAAPYRQGDRVSLVLDGETYFGTVQHDQTPEDDGVVYLRLDGDDLLRDSLHAHLDTELSPVLRNTFLTPTKP